MSLTRHGLTMLAILAAASAPALALAPASSQTLCNAIGSEISQPPQSGSTPAASAPLTIAREAPLEDESASGSTSGGGGEALVEPRGRWKSLLPGAFK